MPKATVRIHVFHVYVYIYIYIHKGRRLDGVYVSFCLHTVGPATRYKRESSRPEGELARSVRLKPANVSLPVSAICACGPLPDEARRTGNERSCTMTSTSAFFTATIAATPTKGRGLGGGGGTSRCRGVPWRWNGRKTFIKRPRDNVVLLFLLSLNFDSFIWKCVPRFLRERM